jgi:hypothetical protein
VVSVAHLTATQQSRGLMTRQTETRSGPGQAGQCEAAEEFFLNAKNTKAEMQSWAQFPMSLLHWSTIKACFSL